ncbi:tRNA lysidine(34) synthetase TilS [Tabrizicola sp.]|uniref:tRNA lysidine(34) synthetase TilS n=1 Tax=Tabrizicola sp. TaxID=2005166 RepID=UPI00261C8C6C|nr:tRNA lysidine(34) synthetase TilS [Tabrizicola sp.]MDM7933537.1 tRNA lysidine(34) synthetase TilS [Tabrizicola sp.]
MQKAEPDAALLARARAVLAVPGRVGLAVSGGGDSMAMLHLMAHAAQDVGDRLHAVTVDHRLRPEAAAEAAFVASVCAGLGIPHSVLVWEHDAVTGNLMEAARTARYRLLTSWAKAHDIGQVVLAHTADDQAETFLMGLSRAAGLDGLSGMRPQFQQEGVTFRRPLLKAGRAELREFLVRHGLGWVDDPTNDDDRYTRTRARRALKALQPLGITVERLAAVVRNLALAQGVVNDTIREAARDVVTEVAGALTFEVRAFLDLGGEVDRLLLVEILRWMAGLRHAPRADQIHTLLLALRHGKDATLAGCRFRHKDGRVWVSREARALGGQVPPGALWDGRWEVSGGMGDVRALGAEGLRQCPDWRSTGLPRQVLEVTPALWLGDTLIAAPCAGFGPATATCAPSFHAFLLSH